MTSFSTYSNSEKQYSKWQIRNVIGCIGTVFALIAFCGLLIWIPQLYNNWQLHQFASNLFNYPLPPQTEIINRHAEVGLMGNGNHCDFVAKQVMRTQLPRNEIEAYYAELFLPPVNSHNEGIEVAFQGKSIPVFVDFDNSMVKDGWLNFTIELWDGGYSAGLDLRCH